MPTGFEQTSAAGRMAGYKRRYKRRYDARRRKKTPKVAVAVSRSAGPQHMPQPISPKLAPMGDFIAGAGGRLPLPAAGTRRSVGEDITSIIEAPQRTGAPPTRSTWQPGFDARARRHAARVPTGYFSPEGVYVTPGEDFAFQETLRRATQESLARGGGGAAPKEWMAPSGPPPQEWMAQPAGAGARIQDVIRSGGRPGAITPARTASLVPPALSDVIQRGPYRPGEETGPLVRRGPDRPGEETGPIIELLQAPLVEHPVSVQRHLPPGRYSRPLPGIGTGGGVDEEAEANQELREAMLARRPPATAGRPVRSMVTGKSLGRFSEPFMGSLGEYTQASIDYRDALARGEEAERPGAFRPSPGEIDITGMMEAEDVMKGRRLARRAGQVPQDIRRRRAAARAEGRDLTTAGAEMEKSIEQVIRSGGKYSPEQQAYAYGPEAAAEMQRTEVEERAHERASISSILANPEFAKNAPPGAVRDLLKRLGPGEGGEAAPATPRESIRDMSDQLEREFEEGLDAAEWERKMRTRLGDEISDEQIAKFGRQLFGEKEWSRRNEPGFFGKIAEWGKKFPEI